MTTDDTPRNVGSPLAGSAPELNHPWTDGNNEVLASEAAVEADRDRWRARAERAESALERRGRSRGQEQAASAAADPIDRVFDPSAPVPPFTIKGQFAIWLGKVTIDTLRIFLGLIFLGFGLLKFFPEVSPAEDISRRTVDTLTFGLLSGDTAGFLVALVEVSIGFCLVTGLFQKFGLALLGMAMIGIMSPLVLFPEDLFAGKYHAPTLLGQYVLKDFVLLAAGLVIIARELGKQLER